MWLTPTLGQPPVPLGTFSVREGAGADEALEVRKKVAAFSPFTYISNGTGQPAMSVPLFGTVKIYQLVSNLQHVLARKPHCSGSPRK